MYNFVINHFYSNHVVPSSHFLLLFHSDAAAFLFAIHRKLFGMKKKLENLKNHNCQLGESTGKVIYLA
jgi:hypothetical protein